MAKRKVIRKNKKLKEIIVFSAYILAAIIVIYLIYVVANSLKGKATLDNEGSSNLDTLAKCLADNGAKVYGAYWCPHCQNQKALFGESVKYLSYVECDSSGENANPAECAENSITGYPTWVINGQNYPGEKSLEELKSISGC